MNSIEVVSIVKDVNVKEFLLMYLLYIGNLFDLVIEVK